MNKKVKITDDQILKTKDLTIPDAASILKCGVATIFRRRKKLGISSGKVGRWNIKVELKINCKNCNVDFITNQKKNTPKFCSHKCYTSYKKGNPEYKFSEETCKLISRNRKEQWKNPTEKMKKQHEKLKNPNQLEYKKYMGKVRRLTYKLYEENKKLINPNNYPITLCGVEGGYQIEHIKSIKSCWNENISIEEAASLENITVISWEENLKRRDFKTKWL